MHHPQPLFARLIGPATAMTFSFITLNYISAASLFWDGGAADIAANGDGTSAGSAGTWDTSLLNWDQGTGLAHIAWPNASSPDAVFAGTAGTVTLGEAITAGNLSVSTTGYTFATAAGAPLTLSNGITITNSFATISGAGGLVISGPQTFSVTGSTSATYGGINISAALSGSDTISKTGLGMIGLSGNNSAFTGKIIVSAGRFAINSDAALGAVPASFVPDSITLNGGTLLDGISNNVNGAGFANGGSFTINANRGITLGSSGGTIQVGYNTTRMIVSGVISGTGSLAKADGGDLVLLGANTYSGGTNIAGGTIVVGELNAGDAADGTNTSLGSGAVNVASGAQLVIASNNSLTLANNITLNGSSTVNSRTGSLIGGYQTGGNTTTLTGTLTLAGSVLSSVGTAYEDKILALNGKVTGNGGLQVVNINTVSGGSSRGGIVVLGSSLNDYQGDTIVNNNGAGTSGVLSTLRLGADNAIPDGAGKGNVTVNGNLNLNGFTDTINGLSGTGVVATGSTILKVGNNDATSNFAGKLTSGVGGGLQKIGAGTLTLSGADDNSGGRARVDAGTLVIAKASTGGIHALGTAGGTDYALVVSGGIAQLGGTGGDQIYNNSSVNVTGGTLDMGGTNEVIDGLAGTSGGIITNMGATASTLTLGQNNSNGSLTYAGAIQNGTSQMAVTKVGSGTQTLSGISTYTGATTISGTGSLFVNGTIASSAFNVGAGSTLGGNGTVGATTVTGGILAPGAGIGTLNTGALSLNSVSVLKFDLAQAATVGGVNDFINVTGSLTLDGTLQVTQLSGFAAGIYRLMGYSGTLTNNGLNVDTAFLAHYPGSHVDASTPNQINLVVVPEPAILASLWIGAGLTAGRRRRDAQAWHPQDRVGTTH